MEINASPLGRSKSIRYACSVAAGEHLQTRGFRGEEPTA